MKVADWIRQHGDRVLTIPPELGLGELSDRLLAEPCRRDLYVREEDTGRLVGHIPHRRVARLVLAHHRPVHTRREIMNRVAGASASELMEVDFATAVVDEELDDVLHRMLDRDVEEMPVLAEDGSVIGAVNLSEVLRAARRGELDG